MALSKAELLDAAKPRPEIIRALADGWEHFIDENLRTGHRQFSIESLPRIRTPLRHGENEAALNEIQSRYSAVGWAVKVNDVWVEFT